MRPYFLDVETADPLDVRDKALSLRESVNSSRARMSAQREKLERLRFEVSALRELMGNPRPAPAAAPSPLPPAPVRAVPDEAPATASFKDGVLAWKNLPYALIFLAAIGLQIHPVPGRAQVAASPAPAPVAAAAPLPPAPSSPEVVADDDGAAEALLLAHDWRLPGDDRPLAERLGSLTTPPGALPEWTAEPTGERTYRVSFRPGRSDAGYDFDVDLTARRVDPTPETAELIAPRLASRR